MEILHFNLQQASYYKDQWRPCLVADFPLQHVVHCCVWKEENPQGNSELGRPQWTEARSRHKTLWRFVLFSVDFIIWRITSFFILHSTFISASATFEVVTAEITPFCLTCRAGATKLFLRATTKTQCSTFFSEVPCFGCRCAVLPISGSDTTLDQLTFLITSYSHLPQMVNKRHLHRDKQWVFFFPLAATGLGVNAVSCCTSLFYSVSSVTEKNFCQHESYCHSWQEYSHSVLK